VIRFLPLFIRPKSNRLEHSGLQLPQNYPRCIPDT